jgi:acid phosphatase type 7
MFRFSKKISHPAADLIILVFILSLSLPHCTTFNILDPYYTGNEVLGLVLTWQQDPTTTMTIDWHAMNTGSLQYRQQGDTVWIQVEPERHPYPFSDRTINRVELTGLQAGTYYEFTINSIDVVFQFRTMPSDAGRPIRFAAGGDVMHQREWMEETNRVAASYDPDFIVWGGDLAYADGREDFLHRWYDFFVAMRNTLILEDGRVIPVLVTLGNHEGIRGGFYRDQEDITDDDAFRERVSPYFYRLFAMPGHPGYNVLDFGDYMSIVLLDSGHNNPVEGAQTEWLRGVLEARRNVPHVFPVYHVPAYPSFRSFDLTLNSEIRENWVPLFEQNNVRVVFENHDHLYKRTHPIRENRIDSRGVVYIGDGAWGVSHREPRGRHESPDEGWYLREAISSRHFILTTIQGTHQHFLVVSNTGQIIDEYPEPF